MSVNLDILAQRNAWFTPLAPPQQYAEVETPMAGRPIDRSSGLDFAKVPGNNDECDTLNYSPYPT